MILGAGLDTFAYRNPYTDLGLRVFEVDHPATQAWKQQQLTQAQIPVPDSVTFTPLDFESQTLHDQLHQAGFTTKEPALFSWLGVTMYLQPETVTQTLHEIALFAPSGSVIVFDYMIPTESLNPVQQTFFRVFNQRMTQLGEPWQGFFNPDSLIQILETLGYKTIENLEPEVINSRFFDPRTDNLKMGNSGRLIKATL